MYGKQTETAIAAVGYLAEIWQGPRTRRVSAADIADARSLQRPFVAKLLSALSQASLVSGSPGPGGGYALAKDPTEITLRDVWLVFERPEPQKPSAHIGPKLEARIRTVQDALDQMLDGTTFDQIIDSDLDPTEQMATAMVNGNGTNGLHGGNGINGSGSNGNGTNGTNGTNGNGVNGNGTNGVNGNGHA